MRCMSPESPRMSCDPCFVPNVESIESSSDTESNDRASKHEALHYKTAVKTRAVNTRKSAENSKLTFAQHLQIFILLFLQRTETQVCRPRQKATVHKRIGQNYFEKKQTWSDCILFCRWLASAPPISKESRRTSDDTTQELCSL